MDETTAAPSENTDAWVTPEEATDILGVPRKAIIARITSGQLTAVRLPSPSGKARRYRIVFGDLMDAFDGDLLTIEEFAARIKASRRYVYYLIEAGHVQSVKLPSRRTGKPWGQRIPRARAAQFLARLEDEARADTA